VLEPLFQVKIDCQCCEQSYQTSRVRPSFKKPIKRDSDFCAHYKEVNPEYYVVRVCPYCGFASTENFSERMSDQQKKAIFEKVSNSWTFKDFGGERSWIEAMQTYKLALVCAQIKEESDRVISGILHHIAWLYRYEGIEDQEKRFLQYALESYVQVYELEGVDLNNARLMFLIGELNSRLKHYNEAVKWFARVVNDKKIMDAGMIRASRERWQETREVMKAEQMELPEELD
jgi:uncharacterized protein (DUF2225 family)